MAFVKYSDQTKNSTAPTWFERGPHSEFLYREHNYDIQNAASAQQTSVFIQPRSVWRIVRVRG